MGPATASSFKHMDKFARLTIENKSLDNIENGLQIGFTIDEMANRVEALLKSAQKTHKFLMKSLASVWCLCRTLMAIMLFRAF